MVIDYVMKNSEENQTGGKFGFRTQVGNTNVSSERACRPGTRRQEIKINDADFANDIALAEGEATQAQLQINKLREEARKVGLEYNNGKIVAVIYNPPSGYPELKLDGAPIETADDFKYLGSFINSTQLIRTSTHE